MKKTLLIGSSLSALALVIASGAAQAQDAGAVESVTVTGVQASVSSALNIKENAGQIVDSIVSEDIGKLPDSTVVESLQHVTGISIIRNSVEPSTVLIRGLPDIQTLLNGREFFTSTGRSLSLPDLPSELLARVDVHKASSATDLEGGIAGLIDVRLHRPFDFDGLQFAGGVQAVTESLAGHVDPQLSALASNRWQTDIGEIGLLLDVSYKDIHNRADEMQNQSPQWSNIVGPVAGAGSAGGSVCVLSPATGCPTEASGAVTGGQNVPFATGVRPGYAAQTPTTTLYQHNGSIERASLNLSGQWKPSASVEAYAEGFYTRRRTEAPTDVDVLLQYVCPDAAQDTVYPGTNIVSKSVSSCYNLTSDQDSRSKEDSFQGAAGLSWNATENFLVTTEFDATLSNTLSTNYIPDDTYNIPTDGLQLIDNFNGSGAHYITSVGNQQSNPAGEYIDQFFDQRTQSRGSEWDWRIDGQYNFAPDSFVKTVEFGFRIADRSAHNNGAAGEGLNCITQPNSGLFYNNYIQAANTSTACIGAKGYDTQGSGGIGGANLQAAAANYTSIGGYSLTSLPAGAYSSTHGSFFGGKFGITGWTNVDPTWLYYNVGTIRTLFGYGTVNANSIQTGQPDSPANLFIVSEVSKAGYLKTDYGFPVFGYPVDGNVGVRFIDTTLTEQANNSTTTGTPAVLTYTPTISSHETSDFLPSLNVRVTLDDGLFFRFAASKTATRPTFSQLNPAQSFNGGGTTLPGSSSSGNPNLSAEKSVNLDVDLEYYWGKANHVSVAGFHRDVSGYIQTQSQGQITVNGLLYNYSKPVNFQNAPIDGVEAGYSQFLDFLPGFWSGFGWDTNATYISGIFNNITKWHANAAGIYEQGPYSFRLSYTWSSDYLINPTLTPGVQPQFEKVAPRTNVDASFNYKWNDQLTFTLDATNLNNGKYKAYDGNPPTGQQLYNVDYEDFDRTISVGVRYHM